MCMCKSTTCTKINSALSSAKITVRRKYSRYLHQTSINVFIILPTIEPKSTFLLVYKVNAEFHQNRPTCLKWPLLHRLPQVWSSLQLKKTPVKWPLFQSKIHPASQLSWISPQNGHHYAHHILCPRWGTFHPSTNLITELRLFSYVIYSSAKEHCWQCVSAEEQIT